MYLGRTSAEKLASLMRLGSSKFAPPTRGYYVRKGLPMPIMFLLFLLFTVATVAGAIVWLSSSKERPASSYDTYVRGTARLVTLVLLLVTVILLVLSSTTMVTTKRVGVVTEFGKPSSEPLDNGLHFKAPWAKVTEFDVAKQVDEFTGGDHCVNVRMAGQTTACVSAVITWRAVSSEANSLYQDYKDFEKVRSTLVKNNVKSTLSEVFSTYNPLAQVAKGDEIAETPDVSAYADDVKSALQVAVGDEVEIVSVTTPYISYDDTTQARINELQAEVANTRIAEQRKLTAEAEAAANAELAESVGNDPNVLVSKCLDILSALAKDGKSLPNGFSCWPGAETPPVAIGVK